MTYCKNNILPLSLLLLVTVFVYSNGLHNPFVTDDRVIILDNFQFRQSWTFGDLFQRSLFGAAPSESTYFRPLTLFTFALNYRLAGEKPLAYRAVNVGLHMMVVVLAFQLFSCLARRWVATFSALLYALHPVHVQAVSYISSRSDLLYTVLALWSLLLWHQGNHARGIKRAVYLGSALCVFFFGLFAKENIIVVPVLAVAMDLLWNQSDSWRDRMKESFGWYLGFIILFAIYVFIRLAAGFPFSIEVGREFAFSLRVLLALQLFALYLGVIFYPAHLSLFRVVPIPESFFEWQVILGAALMVGMLVTAWLLRQARKEISFGLLWYLVSIGLVLNLILLNAPMMEHWLYLPLFGLALALVGAARSISETVGEVRGVTLGLIFLAVLLAARTVSRNGEWSDLLKLFSRDVSHYPGNWRAWTWLGDAMRARGMANDAIRAYKTSLTLNPKQIPTWIALGEALAVAGRNDEAEEIFLRAVAARPKEPWYWYRLGVHRLKAGKYQQAVEPLEKSIGLNPYPLTYHILGSAYLRLEEKEKAEEVFQQALLMFPGDSLSSAAIHVHLGKLYLEQQKRAAALEEWRLALRFDPGNEEAKLLLGKGAKDSLIHGP